MTQIIKNSVRTMNYADNTFGIYEIEAALDMYNREISLSERLVKGGYRTIEEAQNALKGDIATC